MIAKAVLQGRRVRAPADQFQLARQRAGITFFKM
jgi:hypothetical protein